MSDTPAATPSATPAAVAPVVPTPSPAPVVPRAPDPRLPESAGIKPDTLKDDIDKFFAADEAAAPVAPTPAPAAVPAAAPVAPEPGSVAAKLAAKGKPAAPVAPVAAAPDSPDAEFARIEAEMVAHTPKWKPAEGWEKLKTVARTEATTRARLEKELADAKAKLTSPVVAGMTAEAIADLQAREKAASDRLMVLDLQSHPTFKANFIEPMQAEITKANEILAAANIKVDVAALIAKPRAELGKAVAEAIKDLPEFDRVEVAEAIRKAHTLDQSARSALAQSKDLGKALQVQSVERQRKAFASRWAPVSAAIGEFAQPVETPATATPEQRAADEAYNAELSALRTKAEAIALSPISDEAVAESAIKAAAYDLHVGQVLPRVLSEYQQVVDLNRQLVAEVNALRSRNPNHKISAIPGAADQGSPDPAKMSHSEAAEYFFGKR